MGTAAWGQFFALASAFAWALAVVLLRLAGTALPAFELNLFKNVLGLVLVLLSIAVVQGLAWPEFPLRDLAVALLSGYLGIAVADTWYLRALHDLGASRMGIVASMLSPFVILLSIGFLDERLGPWQVAGLMLVLSGILLVTWKQNRREVDPRQLRRGLLYGVSAVFLMAVGIVMVKEILETRDFLWTMEIRLAGGVAGMLLYTLARRRVATVAAAFRRDLPWGLIVTGSVLASYISMMMWLAGYKLIPASVASILNETAGAWMVLLAWLILREELSMKKILGITLTTSGVMIMMLL
jgi:drug/metabolite transporter (DMT)-like permease